MCVRGYIFFNLNISKNFRTVHLKEEEEEANTNKLPVSAFLLCKDINQMINLQMKKAKKREKKSINIVAQCK